MKQKHIEILIFIPILLMLGIVINFYACKSPAVEAEMVDAAEEGSGEGSGSVIEEIQDELDASMEEIIERVAKLEAGQAE